MLEIKVIFSHMREELRCLLKEFIFHLVRKLKDYSQIYKIGLMDVNINRSEDFR